MSLLLKIPVKPFMKDFIRSYYKSDTIALTPVDDEYKFIYSMLQRPPIWEKPKSFEEVCKSYGLDHTNPVEESLVKLQEKHNRAMKTYNKRTIVDARFSSYVTLQISDYFQREKRFYISPKNVWRFHHRYHEIFKQEFFAFMDKYNIVDNFRLIDIIFLFMAEYNWSEDMIQVEALKKLYYRNKIRTKPKKKIILPTNDQFILDFS